MKTNPSSSVRNSRKSPGQSGLEAPETGPKPLQINPGAALFLVLAVADVFFLAIGNTLVPRLLKPLLMPSLCLAALLYLRSSGFGLRRTIFLIAALACHTAGDVFLMFSGEKFFLAGMAAFLAGHIFYFLLIGSYMKELKHPQILMLLLLPPVLSFALSGVLGLNGFMRICVTLYGTALLSMAAFGGAGIIAKKPCASLIFFGALLFIASDSILAFREFRGLDFPFRNAAVMATYISAEALIVSGIVFGAHRAEKHP